MIRHVVRSLICPYCGESMSQTGGSLSCRAGHVFDIARQGYVSLLPAGWRGEAGDTAEIVAARERFLAAGHFAALAARLADLAVEQAAESPGCVIDAGVGTGYYLAAVLERLPDRVGLGLDVSKYALRRAARAHDRVGAVGCDIWQGLPVADGVAALVLNVFAPRNAAELARVLHPSGRLLVVTPSGAHLGELVSALDLVTVDERKSRRLAEQLGPYFELVDRHDVTATMSLSHDAVEAVVGMGPSAWHADPESIAQRVRQLPDPARVTLSVTIGRYRPSR